MEMDVFGKKKLGKRKLTHHHITKPNVNICHSNREEF